MPELDSPQRTEPSKPQAEGPGPEAAPILEASAAVGQVPAPSAAQTPDPALVEAFEAPTKVQQPLTPAAARYQAQWELRTALQDEYYNRMREGVKTRWLDDTCFVDRINAQREKLVEEIGWVTTAAIKRIPGIQVEGELVPVSRSGYGPKDRLEGMTVTFPEDPSAKFGGAHSWAVVLYDNGRRHGINDFDLSVELSNEPEEIYFEKDRFWDNESGPIEIAADVATWVKGLPAFRAERLEDRLEEES